jgi:hypothetical protein
MSKKDEKKPEPRFDSQEIYVFRFNLEESCAIVDGLETLIEEAYPKNPENREDGEEYEVERLNALIMKIGERIGVR